MGKIIGKGKYAQVNLALSSDSQQEFAIKSMEKYKIIQCVRTFESLFSEIDVLRELDHKGIIKLFCVYESDSHIHLIMEYLKGGELFDHIQNCTAFTEKEAIEIMRNIIDAVAFIHSKGIIHRDIKPENIIMVYILNRNTEHKCFDLKIADFGLANFLTSTNEFMKCGSPGYVAPEIWSEKGYGSKADIFSCGIIMYVL